MALIAAAESSPMGEINMTPLIDVMLVLLVMFIITIPIQTHAVKLDLPKQCSTCGRIDLVKNKIVVTPEESSVECNVTEFTRGMYRLKWPSNKGPHPTYAYP